MHVVFVEPAFPSNQREFVRGLHTAGAHVTGIGEAPLDALDSELKAWMSHYVQIPSVVHQESLYDAVRSIMQKVRVDRLEATVEAHVMAAAQVREALDIPGTSVKTTFLCRDKPAMKQALREAGVACAQSTGAATIEQAKAFAARVGYPLIMKPSNAAGAAGTHRVENDDELVAVAENAGLDRGGSIAIEEFIEGHEGFYDTISIDGRPAVEFMSHYYPGVLEAMRTRWISPQFITTNRIDADGYAEVKTMGKKVIDVLGIETSPTHMEWFSSPKGLRFSEIGCRPPGVGAWDLYCVANDMDVYTEWANALVHGRLSQEPSRRYAAGIINLRPSEDGQIFAYEGLEEVKRTFGEWILDYKIPPPGSHTQPVEAGYMANAWIRMRHPDYDELRRMLSAVGENVKVLAR